MIAFLVESYCLQWVALLCKHIFKKLFQVQCAVVMINAIDMGNASTMKPFVITSVNADLLILAMGVIVSWKQVSFFTDIGILMKLKVRFFQSHATRREIVIQTPIASGCRRKSEADTTVDADLDSLVMAADAREWKIVSF